ncbi:hypothetical protein AJ79_09345 [Helicocarpus griseus UAMH5409]|uniref:Aquaporin n=1 Tax=Helicocarpus griseus UAMH5409 TaxID=1447875 RepID=A0A2B7WKB8_9EURO|nr:hypothetical protein AJ79_09345 [Helicocarpus griseus UAMH5409]
MAGSKGKPNDDQSPASNQSDETLQETANDEAMEQTPRQYSLAGNVQSASNKNDTYLHPDYMQYNPQYSQQKDEPVWSLAQPLPRVVRPGMRMGDEKEENQARQDQQEATRPQPPPASQEPPAENPPEEEKPPESKVAEPNKDGFLNLWNKYRYYVRQELAEWLGATVAFTLGLCATLSTFTSQKEAGNFPSLAAAWGLSFMTGIYLAGGVSGGHLNPAITVSMSVWRGFPARRCVTYIAIQILASIAAGGIAYGLYRDAIFNSAMMSNMPVNESPAKEAMVTTPKPFANPATSFFSEFVGTAVLVGAILALGDDTNAPPGAGMQAFILGLLITLLILALGYNSGGCFNGARDFGPRLVVLMAGWGGQLFRENNAWWIWGPWCADILGGLFGGFVYDFLIFTGGESPLNYPPRRRKRAVLIKHKKMRSRLPFKRKKVDDLEQAVRNTEQ